MRAFKTILSTISLTIFMTGLPAVSSFAQDNAEVKTAADVKAEFAKDKTGTNPVNFTFDARLYNEYRWLNTDGGGGQNLTTFEFRAPFASGKWQFRGKVRAVDLKADFNNDGTDDVDEFGFGDIDLRFMTVPYFNLEKKFAVALGVEFFLNTASDESLGAGATSIAPLVFLGFFNPIGPGSVLFPGYQHTFSIDEDDGRSRVNQGLIDLFLVQTFKKNKYWTYVDPQIVLDYEKDEYFMLLELQGGMMVGPTGHSLYVMPSFGIGGDRPYDFSIEVGYKIVW